MDIKTPDIKTLFDRMKPTLRSMEQHREEVVSKFRPLLMVFAVYAMICFMMPYLDLGVPRNLRGNMFYFLLTIGLLAFSVVVAIYYRAYKELQLTLNQKFHLGLTRHLGDDIEFLKDVPDYDAQLSGDMWGIAYNHFEARNLMRGIYQGAEFSFVQASVEQRFMDSLRSDSTIFEGFILSFELSNRDHPDALIVGRSHPSFSDMETKGTLLTGEGRTGLASRYLLLSNVQWAPGPAFVESLLDLDESLRLQRTIRQDLIVMIRRGVLTVSVPVYDRLWELVNWKPFESEPFLTSQLLPLDGALKLSRSI